MSIVLLLALPLMAREIPTISSIAPNALHVSSGEWFMTLQGTHYLPLSGVSVIFSGPAGTITIGPSAGTDTNMNVWVPQEVLNQPGYYSVIVRAPHTIDSNSATLQIIGSSIFLHLPAVVLAEATSLNGGIAQFEVTATGQFSDQITVGCSHKSGALFPFDITKVSCTATDDLGTSASDSFNVQVADNTPPAISVPKDLLAFGKPDGASVRYDVKATDVVDPDVTAACKPESGAFFRIGTSSVTCTSVDRFHNQSAETFRIHVGDDSTPALIVPTAVFAEAASRDGAFVKYEVSASLPGGKSADVKCDPTSGTLLRIGTFVAKCTAFGGAEISETFNITVADTTPPDLVMPREVTDQAPSSEGSRVSYSAWGRDGVDGETVANCYPASGSLFAPGKTTVHCSSADTSRNASSGTFVVTVLPYVEVTEYGIEQSWFQ
jgi:hypothetical protein